MIGEEPKLNSAENIMEKSKLEKILFCFENYEGVEIPAKFIEYFVMRGMKNFRNGHKAGENLLTDFDNELFERVLNGSDITEIVLKYSDGT